MKIKNISIIGLGLIGGSIAKALKESELFVNIQAYDNEKILNAAFTDKVIDFRLKFIEQAVNSDVIFICLPVNLTIQTMRTLAPLLQESTVISDVCGIKGALEDLWNSLGSKATYIGGHPMTGKEKGGYENSDPLLFENAVYIISSSAKKTKYLDGFLNIIKELGARVTFLDPQLHDKIVAYVSHLPQLVSVSLVNTSVGKVDDIKFTDFAAGGFRDMTRIASSNFDIWEDILLLNKNEITSALNDLISELKDIRKFLRGNNFEIIKRRFEAAQKERNEIPSNTKGFITQLHDIFVFVRDKPGTISIISTKLFQNNINIKDIELLKIREGTGGTFRLSFENKTDAQKAKTLLESLGFSTT